jgi:transcription termination factor Rho
MVVRQAKRLLEFRNDVVILLEGIARLAPLQRRGPLL